MPVQNAAAAEIAEQGIAQHDEGHFDAAETLYRQALAIDPDQPAERAYLEALAHRLALPAELTGQLDAQVVSATR